MINKVTTSANLTAAIAAVNAMIPTTGTLQESSPVTLQVIYQAIQSNRIAFDNTIAAIDADIDITSVGSVVVGLPPSQLASALLNQEYDVSHQAVVIIAEAYLIRVGVNVLNAPG